MKVIHLELGRSYYGGAIQSIALLESQYKAGIDAAMIVPEDSYIAKNFPHLPIIKFKYRGELDFLAQSKIIQYINDLDPDIVHGHSRRGVTLLLNRLNQSISKMITRRVHRSEPKFYLNHQFKKLNAIACISQAIIEDLKNNVGIESKKLYYIPSMIDVEKLSSSGQSIQKSKIIKGIMPAQMITRKNHSAAFRLIRGLLDRGLYVELHCYGDGENRDNLLKEIKKMRLDKQVFLKNYEKDLAEKLLNYDFCLHLAYEEGLGLSIIEAMASRLPVISAAMGGASELLMNGANGLLVSSQIKENDIEKIHLYLNNKEDREAKVESAYRHVIKNYNSQNYLNAYLDLYKLIA